MATSFEPLLARMQELRDLQGVIGLAGWDQQTYLPKKADEARGLQLATMQGLYHQRLVDPALGELIASARLTDPDQIAMVRVLGLERARAVKTPERLVKAIAEAQGQGLSAWMEARAQKTFAPFLKALTNMIALRKEQADALGHDGEHYDALLEAYEPGMRVARLSPVLNGLKSQLVPMLQKIAERPVPLDVLAGKHFDAAAHWQFGDRLLTAMGFDFDAGRQDSSVHPFTGGTHPRDVRLTTRIKAGSPITELFVSMHEGGHGLYEQGFSEAHFRTPLAQAPSMGLHESQSRLWENIVARGLPFWSHFYGPLQKAFPAALGEVPLDAFWRRINRVQRGLLRSEADELSYNLHIVLRYELELELMRDTLAVADLPGAWNDKAEALLGSRPPNDVIGVLQDIHWSSGDIGYFPTYSLGNLYSASIFAAARRAMPNLDADIASGNLLTLRQWLGTNIHQQGFRYTAEELVTRVTGRGLTDEDFIAHVKTKYSALYDIAL